MLQLYRVNVVANPARSLETVCQSTDDPYMQRDGPQAAPFTWNDDLVSGHNSRGRRSAV